MAESWQLLQSEKCRSVWPEDSGIVARTNFLGITERQMFMRSPNEAHEKFAGILTSVQKQPR
jgi:hypothetical protein